MLPDDDDDDESLLQHQKLLLFTGDSLPCTDVVLTSGTNSLEHPRNENNSSDSVDGKQYYLQEPRVHRSPGGNIDNCYGWLLHGRERKSSGETSTGSTDISASSSSFDSSVLELPLPKAPDGGWGWMVVLGAFIVLVICDGLSYCFGVLYSELLVQFGESRSKTSLVGSIFFGVSMILGPVASAMTTRYGCRKMTIVGGLLSSFGFILSYFATSIDMLYFTFSFVVGTGFSLCYITSVVIVHFYFDKRRSLATGLAVCGTGVGTFTFAPLMEYLILEYGWKGLFLILAGISLNLVVCGMLFRPLRFTEEERWQHFFAEFDKIPHRKGNLELGRIRNISECSEFSMDHELMDEDSRTMSMLTLPTFARQERTGDSSEIIVDALKSSKNPHLAFQRYMRNAYFRSDNDDTTKQTAIKTKNNLHDNKTFTISMASDPVTTEPNTLSDRERKGTAKAPRSDGLLEKIMKSGIQNKATKNTFLSKETKLKIIEELDKSASFTNLSNAMKSKVVSGMHMGKHDTLGIQLLLFRTDIFYRHYTKQAPHSPCVMGTSCPELIESGVQTQSKASGVRCSIKKFLVSTNKILLGAIKIRLFRNVFFTLFVISNFMLYFWSDIPYMFAADHAIDNGIDPEKASFIISIIGIFNAVGQVFFGVLGDMKINLLNFYAIILALSGVFIVIVPFLDSYWTMALCYALFGFLISITFPFTTVLLVKYLGIEQLTNAYGLLMLMQGIANVLGPPFAGWIADIYNSYDNAFYLSGIFSALSGLVLLIVHIPGCQVKQLVTTAEVK